MAHAVQGAAFEAKLGNVSLARGVFAHILQRYPLHGPVYTEAIKLEERCQDFRRAINLAEKFAGVFIVCTE